MTNKTIQAATVAQSPHKFARYHGDPQSYPSHLIGNAILSAEALGRFAQINTSGATPLFSNAVNLRRHPAAGALPAKHQLLLEFGDGSTLSASVAKYGGLLCWEHGKYFENAYYRIALEKTSPLSDAFNAAYSKGSLSIEKVWQLSLKAALVTD